MASKVTVVLSDLYSLRCNMPFSYVLATKGTIKACLLSLSLHGIESCYLSDLLCSKPGNISWHALILK